MDEWKCTHSSKICSFRKYYGVNFRTSQNEYRCMYKWTLNGDTEVFYCSKETCPIIETEKLVNELKKEIERLKFMYENR